MAILSPSPYADFVATMATKLQFVAKTVRGKPEDHPIDTPPRYLWTSAGISPAGNDATSGGGPDPKLDDRWFHAKVECWGKTEDDCFTLYNCLMEAFEELIEGAYEMGEAVYEEPSVVEEGFKYMVDVRMLFQIPQVDLPTSAQTPDTVGETHPAETVVPVHFPVADPPFTWETDTTTTPPVAGDGQLDAGETP